MSAKRKPLTDDVLQEDFDPQAVELLREQLNLPTVKPTNLSTLQPSNPLTVQPSNPDTVEAFNLETVEPSNLITVPLSSEAPAQGKRSGQVRSKTKTKVDRPKKINIDIGERRHNRLNEIAAEIRASNTEPVAPSERMYPIHLIQIAIDCLVDDLAVDWSEIHKPQDLRDYLNRLTVERLNR